jgi:hypothetical protein
VNSGLKCLNSGSTWCDLASVLRYLTGTDRGFMVGSIYLARLASLELLRPG